MWFWYLSYVSSSKHLVCFCNSREIWVTVFVCEPGVSLVCFGMWEKPGRLFSKRLFPMGKRDGCFPGAGPWFVLECGKNRGGCFHGSGCFGEWGKPEDVFCLSMGECSKFIRS